MFGLTIFVKRSILDNWKGTEYASAADAYFSLERKLMQLSEISRLLKGRKIKFIATVCSKEYFPVTNQICKILKQANAYHMSFSLVSISIQIFQIEFHSNQE